MLLHCRKPAANRVLHQEAGRCFSAGYRQHHDPDENEAARQDEIAA